MLLTTFLAFSAFGFGIWLLGHLLFQYEDSAAFIAVSVIGAVIIMATGGAVALGDITHPSGKVVEKDYTEFNSSSNSTVVNNQTRVEYAYERVSVTDQFGGPLGQLGFGGLELLVGSLLLIRDMEAMS